MLASRLPEASRGPRWLFAENPVGWSSQPLPCLAESKRIFILATPADAARELL